MLSAMEPKDLLTLGIAFVALTISLIGLVRTVRSDRQNSRIVFEQKRQQAKLLWFEAQIVEEERVHRLRGLLREFSDQNYKNKIVEFTEQARNLINKARDIREYLGRLDELESDKVTADDLLKLEKIFGLAKESITRSDELNREEQALFAEWKR